MAEAQTIIPIKEVKYNPIESTVDLSSPRQLKVAFPILLDGDLVMSTEHLGVGYLVSILRNAGAECKVFEVPGNCKFDEKVSREIVEWDPDLIGFSLTTVTVSHATDFGSTLKNLLKDDVYFLAGGPLATFLGQELLLNPNWYFLDGLVRGEGDISMIRFAEAFWTDRDYSNVPSLSFKDSGGSIINNPIGAGVAELDMLPEPGRDQFEINNGQQAYLRLATTRGCTARCTFCNAPHADNKINPGKLWRARSAENIVTEIERLYHKYKFNTFDFVDSTFEDPGSPRAKQRIGKLAEMIIEKDLNIYYNCCMQARNWTDKDKDLIKLLFNSGLEKVLIGIESGSKTGLALWKKKSTVEDNKRAISLLREAGIYVAFGFISYHPWSTFTEIRENNEFLRDYMGHNLRRFTTKLEVYPGAEVLIRMRNEGLLHEDFDLTLNPLAYRFEDERIAKLSKATGLLYGERYSEDMVIEEEPAVFEFETYDIVLHTFLSRILRHHRSNPDCVEIMNEGLVRVDAIKAEICEYNFQLMTDLTDRAEKGVLSEEYVREARPKLDDYYIKQMRRLRDIQLSISMKLHRANISIRDIQFVK
ncbi:MAG: B12-binding domain-containing radical SAM protein [Aestuariibacter sp.]